MTLSTAEITTDYIKSHADIKSCLRKDIINYSALSRLIAKEQHIEKKTSIEAILVAARRYQDKLQKDKNFEPQIQNLLLHSEIRIVNKIAIIILEKNIRQEHLKDIQEKIRKDDGTYQLLEGTTHYTIILPDKCISQILKLFPNQVIKKHSDLALITLKSPAEIEDVPGIMYYLTGLFSERGVNIVEFFSFWTDTLFAVKKEDVNKVMEFLKF